MSSIFTPGQPTSIDRDILTDHVLAGLTFIGGADHPIRVGHAVDRDQRNVGIGDLVDHRRRRRPGHVDIARHDGARGGGAVVERADFDSDAVLLEEALLLRDQDDHHGKDRRNARSGDDDFFALRGGRMGGHQQRGQNRAASHQT
jgi:hypothetical protein